MAVNASFWYGRRVLLTGHTGFKGGWLALWLQSMGAHLVGYSLQPPSNPNMFSVADVGQGMDSIVGDIRDLDNLKKVFHSHQPEVVFHLAAQPLVRYSYQNPIETYATNVMGTVNLLEAVRCTGSVKSVVNITTDKCYENKEWIWGYRENEPLGGYDPYSSSKACAELLSSAFRNSFFNPGQFDIHGVAIATARAGNVIGGGDWAQDRLIPDILNSFENGHKVSIRNPNSIRPWQHVMEPLRGYLTLAQHLFEHGPSFGEAWNFGPNEQDAKSVSWIVETMASIWGSGAQWQVDTSNHPHEASYLKLDISKARSRLDWNPALNIREALSLTVDWNRQRLAGADMRQTTMAQLNAYQELTKQ